MADKPKVKPSAAGIWIGIGLMLLSIVSCVAGPVLAISEVADKANALTPDDRVDVPAAQTYEMEADASGIILGFGDSQSAASDIDVTLTDENGTEVTIEEGSSVSASGTTDSSGDSFDLVGYFTVTEAGTYTLTAEGPTGTQVAILNVAFGSILSKFGIGIGVGFVLFVVGLILAIVTGVRRGKAKKALAASGGGFAPPMGGMAPPPLGGMTPPPPGGMAAPVPPAPPAPSDFAPPAPPAPPAAPGGFTPPPAPPSDAGSVPPPPAPGGFTPPPPPSAPGGGFAPPPPPSAPGGFTPPPPPGPPSDGGTPPPPPPGGGFPPPPQQG